MSTSIVDNPSKVACFLALLSGIFFTIVVILFNSTSTMDIALSSNSLTSMISAFHLDIILRLITLLSELAESKAESVEILEALQI